jgi:copper(I)-binding protein
VNGEPVIRRRLGIVAVLAAALLTGACAAGQQAHTAQERPTIDGANADLGPIALRAVAIDPPTGSKPYYAKGTNASLKLVIVNTARGKTDRLTSISSSAITDWGSYASTAEGNAALTAKSSVTSTAYHTVPLPAGSSTSWSTPSSTRVLVLTGFTRPVYPGTTVPLTFTFADAGSIKVNVPVALSLSPHASVIPEPSTSFIER